MTTTVTRAAQAVLTLVVAGVLAVVAAVPALAQREHTRPSARRSTMVTDAQAAELTLAVAEVSVRPIQVWVRAAGSIDLSRRIVTAVVPETHRDRVAVGQRVRVFSPESRSRMYQATVSQLLAAPGGVTVKASLAGSALEAGQHYVLEIVSEAGEFLSVPHEAIVETGDRPVVYVRQPDGGFAPRTIAVGVRGELYAQVVDGLNAGDQVVTVGSFFIDAEHTLKGSTSPDR